eukprot:m.368897 g.368897  ORF g.368897 m.368897 type:complete len:90 (-) comp28118_c0_seq7:45-314(-)
MSHFTLAFRHAMHVRGPSAALLSALSVLSGGPVSPIDTIGMMHTQMTDCHSSLSRSKEIRQPNNAFPQDAHEKLQNRAETVEGVRRCER